MTEQVSASMEIRYLTPRAREWIRNGRKARVLHVFERSCNLIDERDEVQSLVTADLDVGPFSMLLELHTPAFDQWVGADTPVSLPGEGLILGGVKIDMSNAGIWEPRLDWQALSRSLHDLMDWLPIVREALTTHAPENSLGRLQFPSRSSAGATNRLGTGLSESFLRAASSPASTLCHGLVQGDLDAIRSGATALAGLGPGLTPAGDDFILGAAFATWLIYPCQRAKPLVGLVVANAIPRTTLLSAAWIKAAGRGEAGRRWHNLFDALSGKSKAKFEESLVDLASVGHTSGSDALAGFLSVIEVFGESGES
jgi:hypothetical protein